MKICHIISGDLWAGAEAMAFNLLRELKKQPEVGLSVIILNQGRLAEELRSIDLTVHFLDEQILSFPQLVARARSLIRSHSPHIIHSHRYKENVLAAMAAGLSRDCKLISTQHGMPENGSVRILSSNWLVSGINNFLLAKSFDQLTVVSNDIRKYFLGCPGFSPKKVCTIHNGIRLPDHSRHVGLKTVVGSAGRFFPVKDYPLMVEIARSVNEHTPFVKFELAGDGPQGSLLQDRITTCGLVASFSLCGPLTDMASFYNGIDIYLNTSVHEGIPMSILEAMSHGLPIVAPKVGGIGEIITDGKEGFLVEGRNPHDFAEKILLLEHNPLLREKMGRAARLTVESNFSAEAMAKQYLSLYKAVAGAPHSLSKAALSRQRSFKRTN